MSKPNHLATFSERITGKNALPRSVTHHHDTHQKLTVHFRHLLIDELGERVNGCQVAHFAQGELVVSVNNRTLANQLILLHDTIRQHLSAFEPFVSLAKIHWIYLDDTRFGTSQKTC